MRSPVEESDEVRAARTLRRAATAFSGLFLFDGASLDEHDAYVRAEEALYAAAKAYAKASRTGRRRG